MFKSQYRRDVEQSMQRLLGKRYAPLAKRLFEGYPNAKKVLPQNRQDGKSPLESAVELLTIMFTADLEQNLSLEQRRQYDEFLADRSRPPPDEYVKLLADFIDEVDRHRALGHLRETHAQDVEHEIVGAVRGLSSGERASDRIFDAFLEARRSRDTDD